MKNKAVIEVSKEIVKDVYVDAGKPIVKPTGELLGLIPRAIKAAFAPLEKWILNREYNVAETRKLLEQKLQNIPVEQIETPEPYIAVPALQYISYCMDNEELRDMYANLLATSMNSVAKNGVHPSFVEIIKQLCPDEAKIIKFFSLHDTIPTISVRYEDDKNQGFEIKKNYSNIGAECGCEQPLEICKYFDNLIRLGIIEKAPKSISLAKKDLYTSLENDPYILKYFNSASKLSDVYINPKYIRGYVCLSDFGISFCKVCLNAENVDYIKRIIEQGEDDAQL